MSLKAPVTNISRGSLHDGQGVRDVIYFKGCPLSCKWCHNPETLSFKKEVRYIKSKCIHCGKCVEACPEHHKIQGKDMLFLREGCTLCGRCTDVCSSLALTMCGEEMSVDEVFCEIEKDSHYFSVSKGGVTFSGGECLMYPDFLVALAKKCRENGINTTVESAFFVPWKNVEAVISYIDFFFADLKIADPEKHRLYTGCDNRLIIENITRLSGIHNNIVLRIPVIPGVNDGDEDIEAFAEIIRGFKDGIREIELLKYNNLAKSKYEFVDREYTSFSDNPQTDEEMKRLCEALQEKCNKKCYSV